MISGDGRAAVEGTAAALGISRFQASALLGGKTAHLAALARKGRKVLMVGDGLNDAPALAAAHASMAPSSASQVGRNGADFVFLREALDAVPRTIAISRQPDDWSGKTSALPLSTVRSPCPSLFWAK